VLKHLTKEYEMELRIVAKIEAHGIEEAQKKATVMREGMLEEFPAIETMEFDTNFSLRPCRDQPAHIPGYPDSNNAREYFRRSIEKSDRAAS
jgi:hypothetical protein